MSDFTAAAQADVGASQSESPGLTTGVSAAPVNQKIKTKIDGIEQEIDLEDLKKDYQKYKSSEKRFQEAAEIRKQAQEERQMVQSLVERAQQGDLGWLKGLVPKETLTQWAESELLEHIKWAQMPDSEKKAITAQQEAQQLKAQLAEITQTQERQRASAMEEQAYQSVERDMVNAIKDLGYDYKVTPRFIRRIAEQVYASLEASDDPQATPLPASVASKHAFKGMKDDAKEILSILPIEEIIQMLPPKVRAALRRSDVEDAMSQMPNRIRKANDSNSDRRPHGKVKRMTTDEYFSKMMEKRFNKG